MADSKCNARTNEALEQASRPFNEAAEPPEYGGPSDDPLLQAMYRVVHRYPAGIESLAKQINRTPRYLINAISGIGREKLSIDDSVAITHITGDVEMVRVMAKLLGRQLVKLPQPTNESPRFSVHADNVMTRLGFCIAFGINQNSDTIRKVAATQAICNFIQAGMCHEDAIAISPNEFRRLSATYSAIDHDFFAGSPFHLQMAADLLAAYRILEQKVPSR